MPLTAPPIFRNVVDRVAEGQCSNPNEIFWKLRSAGLDTDLHDVCVSVQIGFSTGRFSTNIKTGQYEISHGYAAECVLNAVKDGAHINVDTLLKAVNEKMGDGEKYNIEDVCRSIQILLAEKKITVDTGTGNYICTN